MNEKHPTAPVPEPNNLLRREIQGPLIARILDEFANEVGLEQTLDVAARAVREDAHAAGRALAERYAGNSIEIFHQIMKQIWAAGEALEYTILAKTEHELSFDVTRCRYAELYEKQGIKQYGFCLSCNRDAAMIRGFNEYMSLVRTQTIMEGNERCDFRIVLE